MMKNEILQEALEEIVDKLFIDSFEGDIQGMEIEFLDNCDADVGCALLAHAQLSEKWYRLFNKYDISIVILAVTFTWFTNLINNFVQGKKLYK